MAKKIIGIILCAALILSIFAIPASAKERTGLADKIEQFVSEGSNLTESFNFYEEYPDGMSFGEFLKYEGQLLLLSVIILPAVILGLPTGIPFGIVVLINGGGIF